MGTPLATGSGPAAGLLLASAGAFLLVVPPPHRIQRGSSPPFLPAPQDDVWIRVRNGMEAMFLPCLVSPVHGSKGRWSVEC